MPADAPPLRRRLQAAPDGGGKPVAVVEEWWPPGWSAERPVLTQSDVYELLGLEYREPWQRDCP